MPPTLPKPFFCSNGITIYHGDCREIAPLLPRVDLLLADPPYGIGVAPKGRIGDRGRQYKPVTWDDHPPAPWVLQMLIAKAKRAILWGGNHYEGLGGGKCWLVWDKKKPAGLDFADGELAWTNLPGAVRFFRWLWWGAWQEVKEERFHPTQKPVALMEWCIGRTKGTRTILDPFMGVGTTLVAAARLGLEATGIELDGDYCADAVRRLRGAAAAPPSTPNAITLFVAIESATGLTLFGFSHDPFQPFAPLTR